MSPRASAEGRIFAANRSPLSHRNVTARIFAHEESSHAMHRLRRSLVLFTLLASVACGDTAAPPGAATAPPLAATAPPAPTPTPTPPAPPPVQTYAEARASFRTHLTQRGPAPQDYEPYTPRSARAIRYQSGSLTLRAWVSPAPRDGVRRPAVLFLHGGFAFGDGDWEMTAPYRDAGFVVLVPVLRGENGQPGDYSLFFDEVDDVLAAADALAALPYVSPDQIFVAGHSAGGTLTMLASMRSDRFRAAASFSGSPDQLSFARGSPDLVPVDLDDIEELRMRSPLAFPESFRCPTRLFYGSEENYFVATTARLASRARQHHLDVEAVPVPGDHFTHVPEAIRASIEFFRAQAIAAR